MISAGLDIDRILHFNFYDKILQITLGQEILPTYFFKITTNFKKMGDGVVTPLPPPPSSPLIQHTHTRAVRENMQQIYRRTPMPKYDLNKAARQLYWNHTSVWVFYCKFAAYFQKNMEGCFWIKFNHMTS